jgi:hypothetical protein
MHRVVNSSAALAADRPATRLAVCVSFAHRSNQGFIRRRSSKSHDSVVAADFVKHAQRLRRAEQRNSLAS